MSQPLLASALSDVTEAGTRGNRLNQPSPDRNTPIELTRNPGDVSHEGSDAGMVAPNPSTIHGRLFLIGCERSGTTLLQTMLSQSSRLFSFPESHFFCRIVPRRAMYRRLGLANSRTALPVLRELADRCLALPVGSNHLPSRTPFLRSYAKAFTHLVDLSTLSAHKDLWLEKTPHHLFQVAPISRYVPRAKFIHILRDGRDVAASIRDASRTDHAYWGDWSAKSLAEHWNLSIRESLRYLGHARHLFVRYEGLILNPIEHLNRICAFAGIEFEPAMLRHWESADQVTGWMSDRPWMDKTHQPLQDTRLKKYHQVLSEEEREYLERHLLDGGRTDRLFASAIFHAAQEVA